jgi:transposase
MAKLGEDITEVLDYIPGRFRVIRHVRPKYACRYCDAITQAPGPALPTPRGRAAPGMLAHLLVSKYTDHLPLYRQSQIYARDGLDLDRSTLSDWVGQAVWLLQPIVEGIRRQVFCRREDPRRRHARSGAGARPRPNPDRATMGVCPRRPAVLRPGTASGGLLL